MLNKLTYKHKLRIALALGLIFAMLLFKLPIEKTITCISETKKLTQELEQASDAPMRAALLQKQLSVIEQALGKRSTGTEPVKDENLLEIITTYCHDHKAVLREFPKAKGYLENQLQIETSTFVVESDFSTLLSLVYQLEQKFKVGKVASVNFQSKRDMKTGALTLSAIIYIQSVKKV